MMNQMNQELAKVTAYSKLDQSSVQAWATLRNDAAHGNYGNYVIGQVSVMVAGIRDFILRNPA